MLTLLQKYYLKGEINMAMGALYERQGELAYFDGRRDRNRLIQGYFDTVLDESGRLESPDTYDYDYTVQCLQAWNHRFIGITEDGAPIWLRKRKALKYAGTEVCWHVMPKNREKIFSSASQCDSEMVQTFFSWRRMRKKFKLAFIYMGIFWTLKDGETLNDAAKRFVETHSDVKALFDKRREQKEYYWIEEDKIYLYEIFKDGAAVFKDDMILVCGREFFDTPSTLWWIMASEGYFSRENIRIAKAISPEQLIAMP